MNEFTYHNIFETKGIEYIITIIFFILLVPFWILINKKSRVVRFNTVAQSVFHSIVMNAPKGLFFSKNHTWAFLESMGSAKVGLNNLLVHLTGEVSIHQFKVNGDSIKKGDLLAKIEKSGKMLNIYSPLSGTIVKTNGMLNNSPDILTIDPYGEGWLCLIEPVDWIKETQTFYLADRAAEWLQAEIERFKEFLLISMQKDDVLDYQFVFQDGGELVDNSLAEMPEKVWTDFQNQFLDETS